MTAPERMSQSKALKNLSRFWCPKSTQTRYPIQKFSVAIIKRVPFLVDGRVPFHLLWYDNLIRHLPLLRLLRRRRIPPRLPGFFDKFGHRFRIIHRQFLRYGQILLLSCPLHWPLLFTPPVGVKLCEPPTVGISHSRTDRRGPLLNPLPHRLMHHGASVRGILPSWREADSHFGYEIVSGEVVHHDDVEACHVMQLFRRWQRFCVVFRWGMSRNGDENRGKTIEIGWGCCFRLQGE